MNEKSIQDNLTKVLLQWNVCYYNTVKEIQMKKHDGTSTQEQYEEHVNTHFDKYQQY